MKNDQNTTAGSGLRDEGSSLYSPLYSSTLRALIDEWLDGPILRNMPFGFQMEYIHGWLRGHPPHLTGVGREINKEEAQDIVFSYFHDPEAALVLEGYAGGGGLINSSKNILEGKSKS
jgi:hypothetical protein